MKAQEAESIIKINSAVIAVMNGMKLKAADSIYGDGTNASYGRIRSAVFAFCKSRNPEKFEELRSNDANRKTLKSPKKSTRIYESSDVHYTSLQYARHYFLTEDEVIDFISYMEEKSGTNFDDLLDKRVEQEKQLSLVTAKIRSVGIATRSNILELSDIAKAMCESKAALEEAIQLKELLVVLSDTARHLQTLDSIEEFESKLK